MLVIVYNPYNESHTYGSIRVQSLPEKYKKLLSDLYTIIKGLCYNVLDKYIYIFIPYN